MLDRSQTMRFAVAALALLMLSSLAAGAEDKKDRKPRPPGVPVLWRAPDDLPARDLFAGPGGEELRPVAPFTFVKEETGGYSKKFRVKDARGRVWVAKLG